MWRNKINRRYILMFPINNLVCIWLNWPGGRINVKMWSYQYRKSHWGDKTILRPFYLHNGISYTGKKTYLYWIRALATTKHNQAQTVYILGLVCHRQVWRTGNYIPQYLWDAITNPCPWYSTRIWLTSPYISWEVSSVRKVKGLFDQQHPGHCS